MLNKGQGLISGTKEWFGDSTDIFIQDFGVMLGFAFLLKK